MRKKQLAECTYCGAELRHRVLLNREHAVGRQFFPEPRPADLHRLVVPSCRRCNELPKGDEDYLRAFLSLSRAAQTNAGKRVHATAMRSLEKDKGLRRAMQREIRTDVMLQYPNGTVRRGMTQNVRWDRIERVLAKWVRGLYWKEYGVRLPLTVPLEVAMSPMNVVQDHSELYRLGSGSWPGTFQYWHSRDQVDATRSQWSFLVWGEMGFLAVTNQPLDVLRVELTE